MSETHKLHAAAVRAAVAIIKWGACPLEQCDLWCQRVAEDITREYEPLRMALEDILYDAVSDGHGKMYYKGRLHNKALKALRRVVADD